MKTLYNILKSQKLGITIGFAVPGLLIIGSLIMSFLPNHYRGLSGEDITFFFNNKKPIHLWFYLLFFACIIYGINTFLCTLDSIIKKAKRGVKKIPLYGAAIVHIGFITTLVAHLIGGLYSSTEPPVLVSDEWANVGGAEMRVTNLETSSYPNGMPKIIKASVTVRKGGTEYQDTIGYNNPILLRQGVSAVLMQNYGMIPSGALLKIDDRFCNMKIGEPFTINNSQMRIADIHIPQYRFRDPEISLLYTTENQGRQHAFIPMGEGNGKKINGATIAFLDIKSVPGVLVYVKNNPSIPLTFVTILFFSAGLILVIFRMTGNNN
ncbi:MAG: hypothetical protein ACUBOA_13465 [Candidatus Loosdrechtia sp.]|uniref:hypothetical protein n=1 Tax=Candidatus Loosdrechtia sp. TaxID=3101272 RepID=UPI003A68364B|nr:MAG: hypothetical protein QY305_02970 [Candidatus Jettenia sp. AMX2]